ncbi:MAG TPA: TonB-dependent receptor [Chitinophagaceae bacterium]|nr:TonB-dependent receptor [Chitinophagaceae bacterium]
MKKAVLIGSMVCIVSATLSQTKEKTEAKARITGTVIDSSSRLPLEYATVTLYKHGENKASNGATSDSLGNFTVTNVLPGAFTVVVESIGYSSFTISNVIVNQKHEVINLKNIKLRKKQQTLQNVTVTVQKKLVENKVDKLIYNAEKDITSQTGVATDVLKKVPQVSVDVDGNVELAGSSSIRFLINGKPSTAFGSSITDVLQSIPASQIKSIEVITNPGAKYDAQGLGGIINIILKKSTAQGINGNVSLTAGTIMQNGSFNFNARKGKFGVNAFLSGNARLTTTTPTSSQRLSTDTSTKNNALLQQDGSGDFNRHGYQTGVGFDWTYKERNNFSGSLNYNNFGFKGNGFVNQSEIIQSDAGIILSDINSTNHTNNEFNEHSVDAGLNYKRNFSTEDQELEIYLNSSHSRNNRAAANNQFLQPQDSLIYGTNSNNPGKEKENEIGINYVQPLSKDVNLGIGGKLNAYDITSTSDVFVWQPSTMDYSYDSALSNSLDYHQRVYAAYSEISFPAGELFQAKIGGRYERTEISSHFSNVPDKVSNGYNTFVPSFFLMRKLGEKQTLKFNYSKRIERPDYGDLNPFINTSDPKNVFSGNPDLKPEIGNRYELTYSHDLGQPGSFMVTLFYRENKNDIQPFIIYYPTIKVGDTVYTNVAVTTRENIGIEKNIGTNIFCDLHFNSKLNVRGNLFFFYRHTINQVDKGYNSNSTNYRSNINASYQFNGDLAAEVFGNFNSARHEAQGTYPSFISYSMAVRKQLWNKKASIALTANNIFSKYINQEVNLFGPGFVTTSIRKVPFRSIGINFTWKFGKLEFKKEKEPNNDNLNPPSE